MQLNVSGQKGFDIINITRTSLKYILLKDLHLQLQKIKIGLVLKHSNHAKRLQFADKILQMFPSFNNMITDKTLIFIESY